MRGKIGAGKSFTARRICEENGAVLLSVDEMMESVFGTSCIGRENHVKAEKGVLNYYLTLAERLDGLGVDAVIDHGFWLKEELAFAEAFLNEKGIEYNVITVEADFKTRLVRVIARTDGKRFDEDKLKHFDNFYEE